MTYHPIAKNIRRFLLFVCCFVSFSAFAHTPHVREAHGIIQSIDYQKRILTLTYDQEPGPQEVIWKSNTQFLENLKSVPAIELKEGAHVMIYYHVPFFGKPYATKVVW